MCRYSHFFRAFTLICTFVIGGLLCFCIPAAAAAETAEQADPVHILLIGQDGRDEETPARADSILLCSFFPDSGKIAMTSFLRDLYVPIPGYPSNRLNAAYANGGMSLLRQTLEENFDLPIDGSIEVDFRQFSQVLDILGGVTIDLRQDEAEAINETVPGTLTAGTQLLTGDQALAYTRIRNLDADGDFSRTGRQQKVLSALFSSYQGANLFTILSVVPKILPMLSTDMEQRQVVSTILQLLPMLSNSTIQSHQIPQKDMYSYSTIRGMSVLTADLGDIRKDLEDFLSDNG